MDRSFLGTFENPNISMTNNVLKSLMKLSIAILLIVGISGLNASLLVGQAQGEIFGVWTTFDDETGEARSKVEIFELEGKAFGKIVKFVAEPEKEETQRCTRCADDDDRKGELVMGMEIIRDLSLKKGKWQG